MTALGIFRNLILAWRLTSSGQLGDEPFYGANEIRARLLECVRSFMDQSNHALLCG